VFKSNANVTRSNGIRTGENLYYISDSVAAMLPRPAIEEAILTWYNEQPRGRNYIQVNRWLVELDTEQCTDGV